MTRILIAALGALAALVGASSLARGAVGPQEVFVLAGQSNMVGQGMPLSLSSPPNARLLEWSERGWHIAADPLDPVDSQAGIGPGMTFGLQVMRHQPGATIGLVMCASGGTSIDEWQPGGALYENCITSARATGATVAGILFLQGETDARRARTAAQWYDRFRTMLAGWRRDLGTKPLFLLGQIGTLDQGRFPAQTELRVAQARAADAEPDVCLVRTADLPNDGVHFTVPAYRVIGARFATAWWRAWKREQARPQLRTSAASRAAAC